MSIVTAAEMLAKLRATTVDTVVAGVDVTTRMGVLEMITCCNGAVSCIQVHDRWNVTTMIEDEMVVIGVEDLGNEGVMFYGVMQEAK